MICSTTVDEVEQSLQEAKSRNLRVGFVPTMGALHEGHLSLIRQAKERTDIVVCSIFVNPTQFNEKSDLDKYPRTIDADLALLEKEHCDLVFVPEVEEIYPTGHTARSIDYGGLDQVMEGANRPGHFDGVVEVVSRLFDIVGPEVAFFGEKDYQQLAIIERMVEQLGYQVEIVGCPILREESGLAMSSRNERLSPEQRMQASILHDTLIEMKELVDLMNPDEVQEWGTGRLKALDYCELEYLEVASEETLRPIFRWNESKAARAFVVARFGEVRLIDNLQLYARLDNA